MSSREAHKTRYQPRVSRARCQENLTFSTAFVGHGLMVFVPSATMGRSRCPAVAEARNNRDRMTTSRRPTQVRKHTAKRPRAGGINRGRLHTIFFPTSQKLQISDAEMLLPPARGLQTRAGDEGEETEATPHRGVPSRKRKMCRWPKSRLRTGAITVPRLNHRSVASRVRRALQCP